MSIGGRITRESGSESQESAEVALTSSELEIVKALQLDDHKLKLLKVFDISLHQLQNLFTVLGLTTGRSIPMSEVAVIDEF